MALTNFVAHVTVIRATWLNLVDRLLNGFGSTAGQILISTGNGTTATWQNNPSSSGTYTPTLTDLFGLSVSTPLQSQYIRVGNVVTVSGKLTAASLTTNDHFYVSIQLPVASVLGSEQDCCGTAAAIPAGGPGAPTAFPIIGKVDTGTALLWGWSTGTNNLAVYYTFTYEVI